MSDLQPISKSVTCAIGEHLVLAQFLKRGAEAYLALGPTQKGWDIAVVKGGHARRVQVKTIDWPEKRPVNGNFLEGFDILVIVLLDRGNERSRFFVLPAQAVLQFLSPENLKRKDNNRTITMSDVLVAGRMKQYEDAWKEVLL